MDGTKIDRTYTCPGETVSYSCVTTGTMLLWEINSGERISFSAANDTYDRVESANNISCYVIRGTLLDYNNNATDLMDQYCYSTLFVTFGRLNETSQSMGCENQDYGTLNITCSGDNNSSHLQHKVAGM